MPSKQIRQRYQYLDGAERGKLRLGAQIAMVIKRVVQIDAEPHEIRTHR
jgi:hypothetical protein